MIRCLLAAIAASGCANAPGPNAPGLEAPEDAGRVHLREMDLRAPQVEAADTFGTVEVTGVGEVEVDPDRVEITFAVETEGASAREASETNAIRMEAVMEALRATDLEGLTIETHGYNLQPRYRRPTPNDRSQRIESYQALNNVRVGADDVEAAGPLIDAAIAAGANRVSSLRFLATDTEGARLDAMRAAVLKARREAETIAEAMGVPLGPPLEVRTSPASIAPPPGGLRMMAQAEAATPLQPSRQTVRAVVTIRYRLGG